jgi:hypothetical protein
MMKPTPPGARRSRKRIPPEKFRAVVAMMVGRPTFSKSVVHNEVRRTIEIASDVKR